MLSYRHAFHAGNHADVLKHSIQVAALNYLAQNEKPFCYIDTHSGPGTYNLTGIFSSKNKEYETGIKLLWDTPKKLPELLSRYASVIRTANPTSTLTYYPGSPEIAWQLLQKIQNCRLQIFEKHPQEFQKIRRWARLKPSAKIYYRDGFSGLISALPPKEKRALVMIDPPYEVKTDYAQLLLTVKISLQRFATGMYIIWHPLLSKGPSQLFGKELCALAKKWIYVELHIKSHCQTGMHGSAVFIINPPWTLYTQLEQALPTLVDTLKQDSSGHYRLHQHGLL